MRFTIIENYNKKLNLQDSV